MYRQLMPFVVLLVSLVGRPVLSAQEDDLAKAIEAVEKAGGNVKVDVKAKGRPVILVDLALTNADDSVLARVTAFSKLERLSLAGTKITDAGMEHLKALGKMQFLSVSGTKITDKSLVHVKNLKDLKVLQLNNTAITDAGLAHLKGLAQLQIVTLQSTSVSDEGVSELKRSIPKLKVMR